MKYNILIKSAEQRDCAQVAAMSNALHVELDDNDPPHNTDSIYNMMFGTHALIQSLIAWNGNTPAGQVVFQPFYNPDYSKLGLWMTELYVTPEMRSANVGQKLMTALARHARANDYISVWWSVLQRNKGACRFYERLGARNSGALQYEIDEVMLDKLAS